MSEKEPKAKDVTTLDVETNVQTTEGRVFLDQLNKVSHVLLLQDTEVTFKGELVFKTGYVGDYKSIQLYKCPRGFFLFFDVAYGKNNRSLVATTIDELLKQIPDKKIREQVAQAASEQIAAT